MPHKKNPGDGGSPPGVRFCASGRKCPAYERLKEPAKLSVHNEEPYCYACRTRIADEQTKTRDARAKASLPRVDPAA